LVPMTSSCSLIHRYLPRICAVLLSPAAAGPIPHASNTPALRLDSTTSFSGSRAGTGNGGDGARRTGPIPRHPRAKYISKYCLTPPGLEIEKA
jgi:hypothetical protein